VLPEPERDWKRIDVELLPPSGFITRAVKLAVMDPVTAVRLAPALKSQIEDWAKQQPDNPSRSEAIRRLVQLALAAKAKPRRP
jgi:hypothetical protein